MRQVWMWGWIDCLGGRGCGDGGGVGLGWRAEKGKKVACIALLQPTLSLSFHNDIHTLLRENLMLFLVCEHEGPFPDTKCID
jgi:hypothetical protein